MTTTPSTLAPDLAKYAPRSNFLASVFEQSQRRDLSPKQVAVAQKVIADIKARDEGVQGTLPEVAPEVAPAAPDIETPHYSRVRDIPGVEWVVANLPADFEGGKLAVFKRDGSSKNVSIAEVRTLADGRTVGIMGKVKQTPLVDSPVRDGNFAVENSEGVLRFYRLSTKAGAQKVQRRASDALLLVTDKEATHAREAILRDGEDEAGFRFSQELEACYICGKSLTDELSRELGIGPECRKR